MHTYATTNELKKMAFRINSQNVEQVFGIQVTFISEIKPQTERFLENKTVFWRLMRPFRTPVRTGMYIRMH